MWMKQPFVFVGAGLVLALCANAEAQRRGGTAGVSHVQLAGSEQVQDELKLSDDQKSTISEIADKLREARQELFQNRGQGGDFAEMREKLDKLTKESVGKLKDVLNDDQKKRLTEIYVQMNGLNALMDADVAKAVKITEDQQKKLATARRNAIAAIREAFRERGDASQEDRRELMAELRENWNQEVTGYLSDEQKELFENLKGEKIEIDRSQFRRRRRDR